MDLVRLFGFDALGLDERIDALADLVEDWWPPRAPPEPGWLERELRGPCPEALRRWWERFGPAHARLWRQNRIVEPRDFGPDEGDPPDRASLFIENQGVWDFDCPLEGEDPFVVSDGDFGRYEETELRVTDLILRALLLEVPHRAPESGWVLGQGEEMLDLVLEHARPLPGEPLRFRGFTMQPFLDRELVVIAFFQYWDPEDRLEWLVGARRAEDLAFVEPMLDR